MGRPKGAKNKPKIKKKYRTGTPKEAMDTLEEFGLLDVPEDRPKPARKPRGKPPAPKSMEDQITTYAELGCPDEEIATLIGMSKDTLENDYSALIAKGRANLRMALRTKQVLVAKQGHPFMLKWLGIHLLDQHDKKTISIEDTSKNLTKEQIEAKISVLQSELGIKNSL